MVAPPRTRRGPPTTSRLTWPQPGPHSNCPRRRRHGPAGWGARQMGTVRHQRNGGTPQSSFCTLQKSPIYPPLTDFDLPAYNAWAVHILLPHNTVPKAGDPTARVTKQLPSTALHYIIPTPNVIVTLNIARGDYYLHATHERSPITIYTFTTYHVLQPPRHHP